MNETNTMKSLNMSFSQQCEMMQLVREFVGIPKLSLNSISRFDVLDMTFSHDKVIIDIYMLLHYESVIHGKDVAMDIEYPIRMRRVQTISGDGKPVEQVDLQYTGDGRKVIKREVIGDHEVPETFVQDLEESPNIDSSGFDMSYVAKSKGSRPDANFQDDTHSGEMGAGYMDINQLQNMFGNK